MTVHFIGAGPGAPDLLTLRAVNRLQKCRVCVYAGSLVSPEVLERVPEDAEKIDSAPLTLDEIINAIADAHRRGCDVARLHSGDPSIYGAIAEQIRRLDDLNIDSEVVPGVPAFAAAAAEIKRELTLPGIAQTVILTRSAMKSSPMPDGEELENLARCRGTLALHLSARNVPAVRRALKDAYGDQCPAVCAARIGWKDQKILHATLGTLAKTMRDAKITRTALILIGHVLNAKEFNDSSLYRADRVHLLRPRRKPENLHPKDETPYETPPPTTTPQPSPTSTDDESESSSRPSSAPPKASPTTPHDPNSSPQHE